MKDQNHKISRQIVDFALTNGVGIIRMEDLTEIRNRQSLKKKLIETFIYGLSISYRK